MIKVDVTNQQAAFPVDVSHLRAAAVAVLCGEAVEMATVSVAVVDDQTIHDLNRRFLDHDYPTDVLSFLLEGDSKAFEGEVVVSAETAARMSSRYGWSAEAELLLYVVHGTLHLVGYDDRDADKRKQMRAKERLYLTGLGCVSLQADDERERHSR